MLRNGDLTRGGITGTLLRFTLPMMAGSLLQQCYNIADTLIVGQCIGADALAANILNGKTAFVNGAKVTGSMPDNGSATATMDGLTTTSVTIPAGYTAGGTVSLTADIEEALAAI